MRRCAKCHVDYPDALAFCPEDGAPLAGAARTNADPVVGSTIDGRYSVDGVLGEGGMGTVYAGRHAIIDKRVAIKVLRRDAAADPAASQRFLAEAKAASKIGQQNIVDITDFGVLPDGRAYFVMEFLDGPTLGALLRHGPLPPRRAFAIAGQIARGLVAAHDKGIIHRDLKPDNVFVLEREGVVDAVKIVDFGIARDATSTKRLTIAGMVMGTPEYMAPEQASGQETDHRADQYALGCMLYEMVTGETPFRGENPMQTLTMHVREPVVPPTERRPDLGIPVAAERIILRAMQKTREDRYASMDEMMRALLATEGTLPAAAPGAHAVHAAVTVPPRRPPASSADPARGRAVVPVALAVALLAGGGLWLVRALAVPSTPARPVATTPLVAPAVEAVPAAAVDPATVRLLLGSTPSGAEVFIDAELLGTTPLETRQPRRDAPLVLEFRKAGYQPLKHAVAVGADADVAVALVPLPTSPRTDSRRGAQVDRGAQAERRVPPRKPTSVENPPKRRTHSDLRDPFSE